MMTATAVRVIDRIADLRETLEAARAAGRRVGLVPTMGYLHDGHASLVRRARAENDVVAVTLFVNPLQFAPTEDLAAYPRDFERDRGIVAAAGGDLLFAPSVEEMYPDGTPTATTVTVAGVSEGMEGASRPSHFAGVATVVAKLFAIAGPCRAYFGEKDFQQLLVIRQMARDLSFPVEVVGCPTVREPDGVAMSSRNVYLEGDDRTAATVLHRALTAGAALVTGGQRDLDVIRGEMRRVVDAEPRATLDYAEALVLEGEIRLLVAARVGRARLLDNLAAPTNTAAH
jgi:pantoate--beta-alanine ligase